MLAFAHLFAGAIIGLILMRYLEDKRVVIACAIGAWLPDLIDKPLGHIFLYDSLDNGRIIAHSLLFLIVLLAIGYMLWQRRGNSLLFIAGIGIISHLYLDSIWELPVTVFFPLLGPFTVDFYPNYFENSFLTELLSPAEWLFGLLTLTILLQLYGQRAKVSARLYSVLERLAPLFAVATVFLGFLYLVDGATQWLALMPAAQDFTLGLLAVVGGPLFLRLIGRSASP